MIFEFVKKVDEPVSAYGQKMVKTGDKIELKGHLAEKARKNPNYQERRVREEQFGKSTAKKSIDNT